MRTQEELNEMVYSGNGNQIATLLNEGYKFEDLGFRVVSRSQDVILRTEYDNTKNNPIEYLIISLSEDFMKLFGEKISISFGEIQETLYSLAFSQATAGNGERFRKIGKRYNLKIGTSSLPKLSEEVHIIYEMKNGFHKKQTIEVKHPKNKA